MAAQALRMLLWVIRVAVKTFDEFFFMEAWSTRGFEDERDEFDTGVRQTFSFLLV